MKKYLFPTITIVFLLIGFLIGNSVSHKAEAQQINWARLLAPQSKVDQLLQMMNSSYVDAIDVDSITEEVMEVLVEKLDPHSAYIPKKDLEMV
ncbi:MAG: hypothetical protein J5635_02940, partial [Paludibacteraceae bacterium]|nr:hypothetical protein [Paludibacteraceae bacterium]